MRNVLYRCPHGMETIEDDEGNVTHIFNCPSKLFAVPGRAKIQCHRHSDTFYVQVEQASGPDFLFVDEDGKTKSSDIILPGSAHGDSAARVAPEPDKDTEPGPDNVTVADMLGARTAYRMLTGNEADGRWGLKRIQDEVEAIMAERGLGELPDGNESAREGNESETGDATESDSESAETNEEVTA